MFSLKPQFESPEVVLEKHISVKAAAEFPTYSNLSHQCLHRLSRSGRFQGIKNGQARLISGNCPHRLQSLLRTGPGSTHSAVQVCCADRMGARKTLWTTAQSSA